MNISNITTEILTTMIQFASRPFPGRDGFAKWFRREESSDPGIPLWCSHAIKRAIARERCKARQNLEEVKKKNVTKKEKKKAEKRLKRWTEMWYRWKMVRHWWDVLNSKTQRKSPKCDYSSVGFVRNKNYENAYNGILVFAEAVNKNLLYACREQEWAVILYNGFRYEHGFGRHAFGGDENQANQGGTGGPGGGHQAATKLWNAFKKEAGVVGDYRKDFSHGDRAWLDVIHSEKYKVLWLHWGQGLTLHKGSSLSVRKTMPKINFALPFKQRRNQPVRIVE
jgi:hypothetical protein